MSSKRTTAGKKRPPKKRFIDSASRFEQLLKDVPASEYYSLRLFITGTSERSTLAVANIRALCNEYLEGRYELEVVDIYQQPGKAADEQIIAAPTLVKTLPMPAKRLIGDLSSRDRVIIGLNLQRGKLGKRTKWSIV